ncbi:LuxR C-terminal-related transcriptional regulator [Actinoplanes sp. NPDC049681]|uniref:helix-turn-helix transcriptional regulator n=1 Tax=Actinoplanes sp. NPDC049681 TaxID=3363905 RepID=UPI0037A7B093
MSDLDTVLRLCTAAFGAPPATRLLDLIAGADGDPQWTRALVDGLLHEGRIRLDDGLAVLDDDDPDHLPERALALAREILAARRPGCRQVLCVAAVLGPVLDLDRIAEMVERPAAVLLPAWQEALDAGLLRSSDGGDLVFVHEVLRRAVAASMPAAIRRALIRQHEQAEPPAAAPEPAGSHLAGRLTAREQTVMALVARGRSNQQIARSLGISSHAVKRHVSNLLIKFDCSNRTEVALLAVAPPRT